MHATPPRLSRRPADGAEIGDVAATDTGSAAPRGMEIPRPRASRPATSKAKRAFDIAIAGIGLLASVPIIGMAAVLVRRDSPGPGFYMSERSGLGGRPFRMVKVRTMYVDAERRLTELQHANLSGPLMIRIPDDPRVTRVGGWLRRTGVDELPQLWNVLTGDMSLVGPRPWSPPEVERLGPRAESILSARPGITGLWQVQGWASPEPEVRIALDKRYVATWSFALDLRLLMQTPLSMLARRFPQRADVSDGRTLVARV